MLFRKVRANQLPYFKTRSKLANELKLPNIVNIYLNPTELEIEDILIKSKYYSIRGVIDSMGNIFCWQGDILHEQLIIENYINSNKLKLFKFACEKN